MVTPSAQRRARRGRSAVPAALAAGAALLLASCGSAGGSGAEAASTGPGDGAHASPTRPSTTTSAPAASGSPSSAYSPSDAPSSGGSSFDASKYGEPTMAPLPLLEAPTDSRTVYLTFDDGPDPTWTPKVLEVLAEYDAKATFFVLGKQIRAYPEVLGQVAAAGMSVQSHSNTHPDLTRLDDKRIAFGQLRPVTKLIRTYAHQNPRCLRPPYGSYDDRVRAIAGGQKLTLVMWTDDSLDWERKGVSSIVSRVMAAARPGAVILFHDAGGERSQTVAALRIVLERLRADGYAFGALCRD